MFLDFIQRNDLNHSSINVINIKVIGEDLRGPEDHEIFTVLDSIPEVTEFSLVPETRNSIKISTTIDVIEDTIEFSDSVLEKLRELGYDIRITHID